MKTCSKCNETKQLSEFFKNKRYSDGYQGVCRKCQNKRMRELETSGARKEVILRYRQSEKGKMTRSANQKKYIERHPQKAIAHNLVSRAKRVNILTKCNCEVCGDSNTEAHHDNYEKPLEVRWLCKKHHTELHMQTGGL